MHFDERRWDIGISGLFLEPNKGILNVPARASASNGWYNGWNLHFITASIHSQKAHEPHLKCLDLLTSLTPRKDLRSKVVFRLT